MIDWMNIWLIEEGNGGMDEWVMEWGDEWMKEWGNECKDYWIIRRMRRWIKGWITIWNEWRNEVIDEHIIEWIYEEGYNEVISGWEGVRMNWWLYDLGRRKEWIK